MEKLSKWDAVRMFIACFLIATGIVIFHNGVTSVTGAQMQVPRLKDAPEQRPFRVYETAGACVYILDTQVPQLHVIARKDIMVDGFYKGC